MDLGTITITSVVSDSDAGQKEPAFDPTQLTDGIELPDDPLPALRSGVSQGCIARASKWRWVSCLSPTNSSLALRRSRFTPPSRPRNPSSSRTDAVRSSLALSSGRFRSGTLMSCEIAKFREGILPLAVRLDCPDHRERPENDGHGPSPARRFLFRVRTRYSADDADVPQQSDGQVNPKSNFE